MIRRLATVSLLVALLCAASARAEDPEPVTVRAHRLMQPLVFDGRLDDAVYMSFEPAPAFRQQEPQLGELAVEQTEMWVFFDDRNVYVSARMHDSAPDRMVADEMRRDASLYQNEHFVVVLDTFHDRRTGFFFQTNPLGGVRDAFIQDENTANYDWNAVWDVRVHRDETGWTSEMVIPFKSLRYPTGKEQVWGINARRWERRVNEHSLLSITPPGTPPNNSVQRLANAATLVGMEVPPPARNIELKPYGVSNLTTNRVASPPTSNKIDKDIGIDAKYGITSNMTLDLTVNTDFAQVEIDEQQVNLTRFSLFYPEKRDFFLEGRGIFDFARGGAGAQQGVTTSDTPYLFYSRRIGLNRGRVIPIDVGGRLTGKVGPYGLGLMNIQTGDEAVSRTEPTNFTVVRVKRDVLRRSAIGAMMTNRSLVTTGDGSNQAYGVDGAFSFYQNVSTGFYWARTATDGRTGDDDSYQGRFDYSADRYGARAEFLSVGRNFNPEVGFIRRVDFDRSFGQLRFSPRPKHVKYVRKFTWDGSGEFIVNGAGAVEARVQNAHFGTEFENSDQFSAEVTHDYELLTVPFTIPGSSLTIPRGDYTFTDLQTSYGFGAQRRVSGSIGVQIGQYYNGTIRSLTLGSGSLASGRISVLRQLSVEPTFSVSEIELPYGAFTTTLARSRVDYGFSPLMFVSALVQYSSADRSFSSNLRFRWEYRPGSELFVVYTDEHDTTDPPVATATTIHGLKNRAFVVKVNRLWRY